MRSCFVTAAELAGARPPRGAVRLHRGVHWRGLQLPPAGSHRHLLLRCTAALLAAGPGAALSHRFAAAVHGVADRPGPDEPVTVRLPPGRRTRRTADLVAHRTAGPIELASMNGLSVTSLSRTLIDVAAEERLATVVLALARAEGLGTLDLAQLQPALLRHAGTPGVPALREALEIASRCGLVIRSLLEAELLVLCLRERLPLPAANARVETGIGWLEVDALWPRHGVVVETDGYAFHGDADPARARRRFVTDRSRWSAIEAAGYRVLVYAWDHVLRRPHLVRDQIAATLAHAAR